MPAKKGGWSARLVRTIEPRDGTTLDTVADARRLILEQPAPIRQRQSWQRAAQLLIDAAESKTGIEAPQPSKSNSRYSLRPVCCCGELRASPSSSGDGTFVLDLARRLAIMTARAFTSGAALFASRASGHLLASL
jgi:hypothetical protein